MRIRPIILCGGEGTRLWQKPSRNEPKQFINFGGWTLIEKTLNRIKGSIFDYPIISTNAKYLNKIKYFLKKNKFNKYKIILEPAKRNTAPAVLSAALINSIPSKQPLLFLPADHLLEKINVFNKNLLKHSKYLNKNNIFLFGIKPTNPSNQYGYLSVKKVEKNLKKVVMFVEKPSVKKAKLLIKKNCLWNSGMFFARKDSIINNFRKFDNKTLKCCYQSIIKAKIKEKIILLNKKKFLTSPANSFDYAILEKSNYINCISLNIPWTDLGNWIEILRVFNINKFKYFKKNNVFKRPWGKYINLFRGNNFLIKELIVNSKSSISLQKHNHRSEHWTVIQGKPRITINKRKFFICEKDSVYIPIKAIHRIENLYKKPVRIMEAQIGSILKESDIVRYKDVYGRTN